MAKLAQEGKIIQGMFVGRKKDVQREMWVVVVHRFAPSQARHFLQSSLQDLARVYFEYIL
jgi:hypothetical protein